MRIPALVFAAAFAAGAAHAAPTRDTLAGFNGIAFGTTFAAAKKQLGAGAKADTDPSDPKIKILIANVDLYGETFAVNYTFARPAGRFSESYAVAKLPTGDQGVCQTRWTNVLAGLADEYGKPDGNLNRLSASIPSQTITYAFADGAVVEAGILGCLLTLNFPSPAAAQ